MPDINEARRPRHVLMYVVGWWAVLFGVWFLLVDSLAHPEVAAGPLAALLAALVALGVRRNSLARYRFRLRWLLALRRVPWGVLRDTVIVMAALWRRIVRRERARSAFRTVGYPVTGDDPESAAWRAFCTFATSVTPNTFVVGIDRDRATILLHQLVPEDPAHVRRSVIGAAPRQTPREET